MKTLESEIYRQNKSAWKTKLKQLWRDIPFEAKASASALGVLGGCIAIVIVIFWVLAFQEISGSKYDKLIDYEEAYSKYIPELKPMMLKAAEDGIVDGHEFNDITSLIIDYSDKKRAAQAVEIKKELLDKLNN